MPVYEAAPISVIIGAPNGIVVDPTPSNVITQPQATIPVGGTVGQVLAKSSNLDFILKWVNQTGGAGSLNSGTAIFSGTGLQLTFLIPHGLASTPSYVQVAPESGDAAGILSPTLADANNIIVNYGAAPPLGTGNVSIFWAANP